MTQPPGVRETFEFFPIFWDLNTYMYDVLFAGFVIVEPDMVVNAYGETQKQGESRAPFQYKDAFLLVWATPC